MNHYLIYVLLQGDTKDHDKSHYDLRVSYARGYSQIEVLRYAISDYRWCDYVKDIQVVEVSCKPSEVTTEFYERSLNEN